MAAVPGIDQLKTEIGAGTALEQLTAASELAEKLRARGDELLDQFVDAARTSGSSSSEIGRSLGTSKQAAHHRFAALAHSPPSPPPFGLVGPAAEVLSPPARRHGQPEELAARVLDERGITHASVRTQVAAQLGSSAPRPTGSLGVAPQTKRLLELSCAIAKSLEHSCPRTEHVLLAAVSPKLHSPAAALLTECGTTPEGIRDHLARMILQQAPELAGRLSSRSVLSWLRMRHVAALQHLR
jgi:hypothetical protein